jgi:23S rRNA (cytidine1920-2'-O)/16S rRNA (cytidine1409-2'-O)-methyltransferase
LAWKLQQDPRVVRLQRNARHLRFEDIGEAVELVTVDLSFISVSKVLPAVVGVAKPGTEFLILVKPQFELERGEIGKGGIVRDPLLQERAIESVKAAVVKCGLRVVAVRPSQLCGAEGNREFFLHAVRPPAR